MKNIIEKANKYKYNSLQYIEVEDLINAKILIETEECILLYEELRDKSQLYWAAKSKEKFFEGLCKVVDLIDKKQEKKLYIEFVPEDFVDGLENMGFKIDSEYIDFWNTDLSAISRGQKDSLTIRYLNNDEYEIASHITRACRGYSRGFNGESSEWIKEWNETENACVIVAEIQDKIVGICCISLYGFESEKGPVLWLRELAVDPEYHSKGIGYSLAGYAIDWGKENGANRSFLACDSENYRAIRLYEKIGYTRQNGRGQINMIN
ncbi:GNAT family N-acetyltransferase [Wukongibacter baidiensis]|uniref:GNAT family N-acetyltransferase n=1 Tax=Wukongibacter baidiensis TaxID=1723361 RepID=UPI003D7FD632